MRFPVTCPGGELVEEEQPEPEAVDRDRQELAAGGPLPEEPGREEQDPERRGVLDEDGVRGGGELGGEDEEHHREGVGHRHEQDRQRRPAARLAHREEQEDAGDERAAPGDLPAGEVAELDGGAGGGPEHRRREEEESAAEHGGAESSTRGARRAHPRGVAGGERRPFASDEPAGRGLAHSVVDCASPDVGVRVHVVSRRRGSGRAHFASRTVPRPSVGFRLRRHPVAQHRVESAPRRARRVSASSLMRRVIAFSSDSPKVMPISRAR